MERSPSAEELLKKIQELEARHAVIKRQISVMHQSHQLPIGATRIQYFNILHSMPQSVFIYDHNHRIIFWGQGAEYVYGYTASEAIGRNPSELLTDPKDVPLSESILERSVNGETWCGQFPVSNKNGETFVVTGANTPFYDQNGTLIGAICVSTDSRPYQLTKLERKTRSDEDPQDDIFLSEDGSTPRGHLSPSPFGVFFSRDTDEHFSRNLMSIEKKRQNFSSNTEECLVKEKDKEMDTGFGRSSSAPARLDCQNSIEAMRSHINTTDSLDDEILWEDLIITKQIGKGSCGTVYHGLWNGSDVAVKVFTDQEFSDDVIVSFRKEVSLMKRLRHPNILLYMGAVTSSPQHLCIVTEFLPRGSLFQILQKKATRFDWKRRLQIAIDVARGMNYLHHCNQPIVHRDLKSSNLLVDKNWTVKVGDFGLSRIKDQTYFKTKSGGGTPQWMAPEIICNEQANEKSDVYSYGVVLWEIVTEKVPWEDLNPLQVIAAVGFMNKRLEIPKDVNPLWASLIESCWCSDPQFRPTFQQILFKLKDLKRKFARR